MLSRLIPVVFAAAASLLTASSSSAACELACPEGTVCGLAPQDCSSPGYDPGEGGAPPDGPVCTGEVEACVPAPCGDASECPAGWSCDDPTATCSIDSEGHETCSDPVNTVCVPPVEPWDGGPVAPTSDGNEGSRGVESSEPSAAGCSMGSGSAPGGAFGALALIGAGILARRRRS